MSIPATLQQPAFTNEGSHTGQWLTPLREHWTTATCHRLKHETVVVRVLIAGTRGSTPRDAGTCMLISHDSVVGTIGGGHLEWEATQLGRRLLGDDTTSSVQVRRMILGKELAQCCGGEVQLWLERFTRRDLPLLRKLAQTVNGNPAAVLVTRVSGVTVSRRLLQPGSADYREITSSAPVLYLNRDEASLSERIQVTRAPLWLYGAGHVGQALVRLLADLCFDITWIDSRAELLPAALPGNVRAVHTPAPSLLVNNAPSDAHHLVLTHDHALDYELCRELLLRDQFTSLGLIGSKSKSAKFRAQLRRDGLSAECIAKLICPLGVNGIASKVPAAIAISITAQLLQHVNATAELATREVTNHTACSEQACTSCHATWKAAT